MTAYDVMDPRRKAMLWRSIATIAAVFGWLISVIAWLFIYEADLSSSRDLAVLLITVLVLAAIITVAWVSWAIRFPSQYPQGYGYQPPRTRSVISGLTALVWLAFLAIWLMFFYSDHSFSENLGVFIASALVILGSGWAISQLVRR